MLNELWVVAEHLGMVGVSFSGSGSMQVGEELKSYLSLFEYYHRKERGGGRGVIIMKHILLLLHIHISRSFISFLHIFSAFSCCSKRRGLLGAWKRVPNPTPREVFINPLPKGDILGLDLINSRFTLFLKGGDWIRLSESLFGPITRKADEIRSDSESDMDRLALRLWESYWQAWRQDNSLLITFYAITDIIMK